MNRRQIILGAGAGSVALIAAGGYWRVGRLPQSAAAPWALDRSPAPEDVRLDAFRHAILAPNPHNRQPWLIRLDGVGGATISCDLGRRLPETDPFDRQITIGFGTFMELARIAAAERGYAMALEPFPEGEPQPRLDRRPVARLTFTRDARAERDPLFAAIAARRTNRELYETGAPAPRQLAAVAAGEAQVSGDRRVLAGIRRIAVAAMAAEIDTPRTWMESVRLLRIGARAVDGTPDGLYLTGPMIETLSATGLLTAETLADPNSMAFKQGRRDTLATYGSVPAILWIATPGNSRREQLDAGRPYARANLRATALGLAMHPMSQALQEYPEVAPQFAAVHKLLGVGEGARLQMLARIGRAPSVSPAPRWPLETHLA